jgi:hypothetical protein
MVAYSFFQSGTAIATQTFVRDMSLADAVAAQPLDREAVQIDGKVDEGAAALAAKVTVAREEGIIARLGVDGVEHPHETRLRRGVQGIVDGGPGERGDLGPNMCIDLLGGGMVPPLAEIGQHAQALVRCADTYSGKFPGKRLDVDTSLLVSETTERRSML